MKDWIKKYRPEMIQREFWLMMGASFLLLFISLIINYYAGIYATKIASSPVTDIILSNIRVYDVDGIFTYGSIIFGIGMFVICFYKPKHVPFTVKSIALFTIIRAVFICLTHIGPFPTQLTVESGSFISKFTFGGDLFFSGHTGLPFLMALIFWDNVKLRYLFIATSILFAIVVLLAHVHYSIDVLGAFFITYTIFHIAEIIFKKDRKLFFS